ncbi:FAD-binding oxidoreductase [Candidatus Parcubacteria bacterium]|nr:FAD-binding oxidoreductase [Candidatus Parcubacteria bacterium]
MSKNYSPWIHQISRTRPIVALHSDIEADVAIVGGGIAGISTAFFALRDTDKSIVLLEAGKIAHGATGHNAGQVASYFERPFHELVEEFGAVLATEGQRDIELAWELIDQIYTEAGLDIYFSRFIGYDGFSTFDQVMDHLKKNILRAAGGLKPEMLYISEDADFGKNISEKYAGFYTLVPHKEVLDRLETGKSGFIAVSEQPRGVLNSALFTEEVAQYLLKKYAGRFSIFENSKVHKVVLKDDHALLDVGTCSATVRRVVLCTNGFENLEIFNAAGLGIDTRFHHDINGVVGRMSGYIETMNKSPIAISYYLTPQPGFDDMEDPYFYLTRRAYEYNHGRHNLICLGGPQHAIPDREEYVFEYEYKDEVSKETDSFVKSLYDIDPNKKIEYIFSWHGLMGYTPNGVRRVGPEPLNPVLMYNLGCNGVGILPSIYGGKRISRILNGEKLSPSIFDPHDQR